MPAELFPPTPRTVYNRNPLKEVVCQFRFPALLRIGASEPVEFQEAIRHRLPLYRRTIGAALGQLPPELRTVLEAVPGAKADVACEFRSEDQKMFVGLRNDSIALTTHAYERWENFRDLLDEVTRQFVTVYSPSFFTRIGLRYVDVVQRSQLGLSGVGWDELLSPSVLGELAHPAWLAQAEDVSHDLVVRLSDGPERMHVRHGFVTEPSAGEQCYLIDCDLFVLNRTELEHGFSVLNQFHRTASSFFRWCITDRLHEALGPHTIPSG